jgi:hypothetical protein
VKRGEKRETKMEELGIEPRTISTSDLRVVDSSAAKEMSYH